VNQINSINENPPPAASQDVIDAGVIVAEATSAISAMHAAAQASLVQARAAVDEKRLQIEKVPSHCLLRVFQFRVPVRSSPGLQVLLDCSQFETVAVHEAKRRESVEHKLNSYAEECSYLRKTLGDAMEAASRDELLGDVLKIREAEEFASQQLLRAPPGSS
jgi:hypothetical protein